MASQPGGSPATPTPRQRLSGVERPFALHPPAAALGTGSSHPYRFSDFDEGAFAEGAGVSAEQAKRALRAHLAETERRMAEAGRLGTALVQQQKDLSEKLREVEELQAESELSPELKKKLAELEKEYDDVARETARAFLPKQRIPSNESTGSPEGKGGRRSLSPVKYESHASGSPSKLTVSNRKQRNQTTNRVHDIEFAAEISTSLISQVRGLQALLAEREEELRDAKQDVARLEDTSESLRERIKELDESEHRYKEENWNLETRIHDYDAAQRDAADNEKKVAQQLALLLADKTKAQRELDELKAAHARLQDEHTASVKHHDIELGTAKRNMAMADSEKTALQRRIDELVGQNQELARAVSMQHRTRTVDNDAVPATSDDDFDTAADNGTPEHSPPASPVKGTPRHSVLESETLKTSLLHAQRTLQSLRTNLHREKTEKLELRRMLQDARDELERVRSDPNTPGAGASKKNRKDTREAHNKLRSSQLGGARSSRTDLFLLSSADPDWEEVQGEPSPSAARARDGPTESSDQFDTANEAQMSDTSFATANDGGETAEDFHTGAEDLPSSGEDTMTETDRPARRRTPLARGGASATASADASLDLDADPANQSTASTSDDDDFNSPRTPLAALPTSANGIARMRLRVSRSSLASRRLRHMSSVEETGSSPAGLRSSPFSAAGGSPAAAAEAPGSTNSTPRATGPQQSLFAELGELDEESDEELGSDGTPSRRRSPNLLAPSAFGGSTSSGANSVAHSPLTQVAHSSKIVMVDRATLTDAVTILPWSEEEERREQLAKDAPEGSRPSSFMSDDAVPIEEKLKEFPSPPTSPPNRGPLLAPVVLEPPTPAEPATRSVEVGTDEAAVSLSISDLISVLIDPVSEPQTPGPSPIILGLSSVSVEHVSPKMPPTPEPLPVPVFSTSSLRAVNISPIELPPPVVPVPVELPRAESPVFTISAVQRQGVEPVPEPEPERPVPVSFSVSDIQMLHVAPVAETQPESERAISPPAELLSMSGFHTQHTVPVSDPEPEPAEVVLPLAPSLTVSEVLAQNVEPVPEPELPAALPPAFSLSNVRGEHVEPIAAPEEPVPSMSLSNVFSQHFHPVIAEEPESTAPAALVPATAGVSAATQTDEWKPEPTPAAAGIFGGAAAALFGAAAASKLEDNSTARSPKRNGFIMPRDFDPIGVQDESSVFQNQPATPDKRAINSLLGWSKNKSPPTPVIAEDDTRQSPSASPLPETPESQRPFKEISVNAGGAPKHAHYGQRQESTEDDQTFVVSSASPQSVIRHDASVPVNHKEAIDAARTGSAGSAAGDAAPAAAMASMGAGPSTWRARTPTGSARDPVFASQGLTPTPRANTRIALVGAEMRPPSRPSSRANGSNAGGASLVAGALGTISRQTSMSSFASEVDHRFNIHDGADVFGPGHSHIDPRMIQAITQTMIGEYLWKYTRKAGRSGLSENRHRRYFWIHPYTRMLYWSDQGPTPGSRAEQRAKSVVIEGVRVVTDDNPMPPGLHRKSLIVISPGRSIKFTCTTGHRHEIWFNALSYLLLRNDEPADDGMTANGEQITREDVDEFNPSFGQQGPSAPQAHRRPPVSLSSYNSRTTRTDSPAFDMSMSIPTLTPTPKKALSTSATSAAVTPSASMAGLTSRSRLSRIGGYWRSSQSLSAQFNSLRGRSGTPGHKHTGSGTHDGSIYEASEVNDSAEELRAIYEAQDQGADRLENVRACCDGKHDVGTLTRGSRRHRHTHGVSSALPTPGHSTTRPRP